MEVPVMIPLDMSADTASERPLFEGKPTLSAYREINLMVSSPVLRIDPSSHNPENYTLSLCSVVNQGYELWQMY